MRDLAVMLADGGECLSDLGGLRDQLDLYGNVASDATAFRVIDSIDEACLARLRGAVAVARARAWKLGARPPRRGEQQQEQERPEVTVIDVDATLTTAHSDKGAGPLEGHIADGTDRHKSAANRDRFECTRKRFGELSSGCHRAAQRPVLWSSSIWPCVSPAKVDDFVEQRPRTARKSMPCRPSGRPAPKSFQAERLVPVGVWQGPLEWPGPRDAPVALLRGRP